MSVPPDETSTIPPSYTTTTADSEVLKFDATPLLLDDDPPVNPVGRLTRLSTGQRVALTSVATTDGTYVLQRIAALSAGLYRLRVSFTTSGQIRTMSVGIEVLE